MKFDFHATNLEDCIFVHSFATNGACFLDKLAGINQLVVCLGFVFLGRLGHSFHTG